MNDKSKTTPLHILLLQRQYDSVLLLLESNPDLNALDDKMRTPLMIAIKLGLAPISVIEKLISAENYNTKDNSGATPIMIACAMRRVDIIKLILTIHAKKIGLGEINVNELTEPQLIKLKSFVNQTHADHGKSLGLFALLRCGVAEDLKKDDNYQLTVLNILKSVGVNGLVEDKERTCPVQHIMQFSRGALCYLHQCGLNLDLQQKNGKTLLTYLEDLKKFESSLTLFDKSYLLPLNEEIPNMKQLATQVKHKGFFKIGDNNLSHEQDLNVLGRTLGGLIPTSIASPDKVTFKSDSALMIYQEEGAYVNQHDGANNMPEFILTVDLHMCVFIHIFNNAGDNYIMHSSMGTDFDLDAVRSHFKDPNELQFAFYGGFPDVIGRATLSKVLFYLLTYWQKNPDIKMSIVKQLIFRYSVYPNNRSQIMDHDYELMTLWVQGRLADLRNRYNIIESQTLALDFNTPRNNFIKPCNSDIAAEVAKILFEPLLELNPAREMLIKSRNFLPICERVMFSKEGFTHFIKLYKQHNSQSHIPKLSRCGIKLSTGEFFLIGATNNFHQYLLANAVNLQDSTQQTASPCRLIYSSKDGHLSRKKPSPAFSQQIKRYQNLFVQFRTEVEAGFAKNLADMNLKDLICEAAKGLEINCAVIKKHIVMITTLLIQLNQDKTDYNVFYRLIHIAELMNSSPELFKESRESNTSAVNIKLL